MSAVMFTQEHRLIEEVAHLLRQCIPGKGSPAPGDLGMVFVFNDIESGLSLSHEEAGLFHKIVDEHLAKNFPKAGPKTCLSLLQRFCSEVVKRHDINHIPFDQELPVLLNRLREQDAAQNTIFIEVSGLNLMIPEWTFGRVTFMHGNHSSVEAERLKIETKDKQHPSPIPSDKIVARIETSGSQEYGSQSAHEKVEEVLDVLQFLSVQENYCAFRDSPHGFGLLCSTPVPSLAAGVWSLSTLGPAWHSSSVSAPILSSGINPEVQCKIDENATTRFEPRSGRQLSELLSADCRSLFDDSLLSAVSWVANGIRERDPAKKYLSLYVALEALFVRDTKDARSNRNSRARILPVEEGVAFVMGHDAQQRRALAKRVRELAHTRNRIVHCGYTDVERADLLTLAGYAWNCCSELALKRDQFKKEGSFRDWLLDRKYGNP